jgi:hypothetical protein
LESSGKRSLGRTLAAAVGSVVALAGGGRTAPSIVSEAYAATRPDGEILEYAVASSERLPGSLRRVQEVKVSARVWSDGTRWQPSETVTLVLAGRRSVVHHLETAVFVDPHSFYPVEVRQTVEADDVIRTVTTRFSSFRRLGLTRKTGRLLTIGPHPGPTGSR